MLARLIVSNFKLIEELDLDFAAGAVAITGETGAGKSSLVQALAAALGAKIAGNPLRPGAERGEVQAWFDLTDCPRVCDWLIEQDLPSTMDQQCVLRRTFSADGRNRAQINGSACTLARLTEAGEQLADLISQNQHHSLSRTRARLTLLDNSWDSRDSLRELAASHRELTALHKEFDLVRDQSQGGDERGEFLQEQMEQLRQLQLTEGSFEESEREYRQLAGSGDLLQSLDRVEQLLHGEGGTAEQRVRDALRQLPEAENDQDPLLAIRQHLELASEQLAEADQAAQQLARSLDASPQKLASLEQHLADCHELARRHKCAPADLWGKQQQWQDELALMEDAGGRLAAMEQELQSRQQAWEQAAGQISEHRGRAATALAAEVRQRLELLGMAGADFQVELSPCTPSATGQEQVTFRYSPAPAVPAEDLGRIASGGELSRLYLALCLASLALHRHTDSLPPLLVLDEVDVGIGGKTAHQLADLVRQLGGNRQVLYVTHLPQVAAAAHRHIKVSRTEGDGEAAMPGLQVQWLSEDQRREELARMLGGGRAGEESRQLADKLLKAAGG